MTKQTQTKAKHEKFPDEVTTIVKVKLFPNKEQERLLSDTMDPYLKACNFVSEKAMGYRANMTAASTQKTSDSLLSTTKQLENTCLVNKTSISPLAVTDFKLLFNDVKDIEFVDNGLSMAICADCMQALKKIRNNTINLIFADAPYNIGKNFGNNIDRWDSVKSYIDWCKQWIDECMRVLDDDGTMYFMTATQHMPYLDIYVSEKYNVLCRIVWTYDSSGVQAKKIFGSLYEPILMINKNKKSKYTFNFQDILVTAKTGAERKLIDYRKYPPQPYNTDKVPGNVWDFSRVRFKMAEYENHPTQKPEALLERIIKASSNPGDIVLDPFSGSFTTSSVATRLGRYAIGIDMNEEFFEIGIRRTGISTEYKGKDLTKKRAASPRSLARS